MKNPLSGLPEHYFPFAATATAKSELVAFDRALAQSGISDYNLVKVSSIIPPNATEKRPDLPKGSLLPVAYGAITSREKGVIISAAVSVGIPEDPNEVGVIMEFSGYIPQEDAERIARAMAEEALTLRGLKIGSIKVYSAGTLVNGPSCVIAGVALW